MKLEEAFLSNFDRDCLKLNIGGLQAKYPRVSIQELEEGKRIICDQMKEVNKRRFLKWLKSRAWVIYSYSQRSF